MKTVRIARSALLSALFLSVACGDDGRAGAPSIPIDELDGGEVPDADAGARPDASADAGKDSGGEPSTENCTGEIFELDSVRSPGRRLSLLVEDDTAHLVYPTPSCGGTTYNATTQGLSYVSLGMSGAPSEPRVLVNGDGCNITRDPALYVDGDSVRVMYTTNARGSYDLASTAIDEPGGMAQVTDAPGSELGTAVLRFGGSARAFFTRELAAGGAPILTLRAGDLGELVPENASVLAEDLSASPLLDGTSLGALAFPSAVAGHYGVYFTAVGADDAPKGSLERLTEFLGAGSAAALASNDDGGAVIYSEVPGGSAHQMRFREIARDGALGAPVTLTTSNQDIRDLSIAPFHGGYLVAFRRVAGANGPSGSMRLLFVDEVGNVKLTSYVGDASPTAGTTQLAIGPDGDTMFIAWSNVETVIDEDTGASANVERVRLARFACETVPKLTCD